MRHSKIIRAPGSTPEELRTHARLGILAGLLHRLPEIEVDLAEAVLALEETDLNNMSESALLSVHAVLFSGWSSLHGWEDQRLLVSKELDERFGGRSGLAIPDVR